MAHLGDLYRQAESLLTERIGRQSQQTPNSQTMREIDELKRIMQGLKNAYLQAGGSKAPEPEQPN